ncbi:MULTISPECIES: hypothetical protein [unclassified Butyrivibrio]|uniref:hypothetical protein n=1 Tax=unclassified Butyrivibrio TaxID=2639466 RepID=UPI000478E890|nr:MULTISPECIES: hypothetical protein [unclassified Butyrivibrio]
MSGIGAIGFGGGYVPGFGYPMGIGGGTGASSVGAESKITLNPGESVEKRPGLRSSPAECETCKNRKYQDGSDEMVSFKSAAHISPEAAPSRVRAHEQEHVSNAFKKASEGDGKVIQASVKLTTAVCPECGRTYVSGGLTTTQIMYKNEDNPYQKNRKGADAAGLVGANFDAGV